ncbi:hypothetical protein IQ07DRAFT_659144 [Pyrenochaeta sp. DS3sAY3a]|nr:hypothetical protein IQ07DRAFT_659144 [Pyrenochaeta sp. DS3sAY3a]
MASFSSIPEELLLPIFAYLDPNRNERVLGDIPEILPEEYYSEQRSSSAFIDASGPLRSLALTCKRFRSPATETLLQALSINGFTISPCSSYTTIATRFICLLRTLIARPELGQHIKQLRLTVHILDEDLYDNDIRDDLLKRFIQDVQGPAMHYNSDQVRTMLDSFTASDPSDMTWNVHTDMTTAQMLIRVLLLSIPRVETLHMSYLTGEGLELYFGPIFNDEDYATRSKRLYNSSPWNVFRLSSLSSRFILGTPATCSLTYLKLTSAMPASLDQVALFPNLHTLDIGAPLLYNMDFQEEIDFEDEMLPCLSFESLVKLCNIRHLRMDLQWKTTGMWKEYSIDSVRLMIQAFTNLTSLDFYAEPSGFRFDSWDCDESLESSEYWNLVTCCVHLEGCLEELRLPGGVWGHRRYPRKWFPLFGKFGCLKKLVIPQDAVFLNNVDPEDDFSPLTALPISLQELKIFDANLDLIECRWLQKLFDVQEHHPAFPELKRLEILLKNVVSDADLDELVSKRGHPAFWIRVAEAPFMVSVGRDDEIPSLCPLRPVPDPRRSHKRRFG